MKHKIKLFIILRYLTYVLTFLRGIIYAAYLGPLVYGKYNYLTTLLMIGGYFSFGSELFISARISREQDSRTIISTIRIATFFHFFFYLFVFIVLSQFDKIDLDFNLLTGLVLLTFFQLFIKNATSLLRENNKLILIGASEALVMIFTISAVFIGEYLKFNADNLLYLLISIWLLCLILKLIVFNYHNGNTISFSNFSIPEYRKVYSFGSVLLLSNAAFYLVILSVKLVIKSYLSFEQLGYFGFAQSLAYAIMMAFGSIIWAIFPKLMRDFDISTNDIRDIKAKILRHQYLYTSSILLLILIVSQVVIFGLEYILPSYSSSKFVIIILLFAQLAVSINAFFNTVLISNKKSKALLIINLVLLLINSSILSFSIQYKSLEIIGMGVLISYLLYSFITILFAYKELLQEEKYLSKTFSVLFDYRVFLPSAFMIFMLYNFIDYSFLSILLFLFLNWKDLKSHLLGLFNDN